jgi:acetyltransferase-like isoleucine patch superfamily enzyme
MSAPANSLTLWNEQPRRAGFAWFAANLGRVASQLRIALLSRFISMLGSLSTPGMKPVGRLQAWALRRMGVKCPSNQVWVGPHVYFDYPQHLELGRRVTLGAESRITARSRVVIGDDFLGAPGLMLNTGTHDLATLVPQSAPIVLGPGVWCGARVTIGAGVTVGAGAVLGSGSVVLRDIPARHLAFGIPCRPQRPLPEVPASQRWSNFRNS